MSQILKWSFNYCSKAPEKNGAKKTKKIICRVPPLALGKKAWRQTAGRSAKADGRWPPSRRPPLPTAKFCRVPGTRQRFFCRRPIFAERPALGKGTFLPTAKVCRVSGSRQRQICRRPIFAECRWVRLSAKIAFAEFPT